MGSLPRVLGILAASLLSLLNPTTAFLPGVLPRAAWRQVAVSLPRPAGTSCHPAPRTGGAAQSCGARRGGTLSLRAKVDSAEYLKKKLPDSKFVASDATNLAQVLEALWKNINDAIDGKTKSSTVVTFSKCKALENALAINRLISHFDTCKDICDSFGTEVVMTVHAVADGVSPGFEVKRLRDKVSDDDFWGDGDDDEEWDNALLDKYKDMLGDDEMTQEEMDFERMVVVPKDDAEVIKITRDWVNVVVSDMGICPFSQSADKAGLPVGKVHYPISRVKTVEKCYEVYWHEVDYLISRDEKECSTTLLIVPEFSIGNAEGFTSFTDTLTQPLEPLGIEKVIQLVYFHPGWVFRDGADRMGEGGAANFARRSPFPMINILRTKQVRLAQKSIPTGLVYTQNEETLSEVGTSKLQEMLLNRNWDEMSGTRVDRRYNKLGKIAQMLMDTDGVPPDEIREALEQQIKDIEKARGAKGSAPPPGSLGGAYQLPIEQEPGEDDLPTPPPQGMRF